MSPQVAEQPTPAPAPAPAPAAARKPAAKPKPALVPAEQAAEPKPAPAPAKEPLAAVVDELGELERQLAPFKAKLTRVEALRKLLRASVANVPAEQERTIYGAMYRAHLGPRENQRTVNVVKLETLLPTRAFCAIANVSLGALETIAPEIAAQVIDSAMTGSRPLTVFAKAV